jgi:hypothetical protein
MAGTNGVVLTCQPGRQGDALAFVYQVRNESADDIYVFDAVPAIDPVTRSPRVDENAVTVALAPDGFAHLLRGIAPLPTDRSVSVRVIPLAAKLPAGDSLERRLSVGLPMHETGPYHPDLPVRDYRQRDIGGIVLKVQYLPSSADGFHAMPVDFAPGLYRVAAKNTVGDSRTLECRLTSRGLSILTRTDAFPRPE